MDTSPNMNIINQDDQYLNVTFPPNNNNHTISFTSISATLDPSLTLEDQLEFVPGGVILILVASTESGEIVRNRVMWTYTMECSGGGGMEEDVLVVEVGDEFAWTMFDKLEPAREEFCPSSSSTNSPAGMPPTTRPTTKPPSATTDTRVPTITKSPNTGPTPTKQPSRPSSPSKPSSPSSSGSKPSATSSKTSKPHKQTASSSASSSSSSYSKSSKYDLSMPGGDLLMDHFDLSKSAKSSSHSTSTTKASKSSSKASTKQSSSSSSSSVTSSKSSATKRSSSSSNSKTSSGSKSKSSSSSRRRRMEHHQNYQQQQQQEEDEEETEVFGRRISQRRRDRTIFTNKESGTKVKEPRVVEFGRPSLKRRLRKRSV